MKVDSSVPQRQRLLGRPGPYPAWTATFCRPAIPYGQNTEPTCNLAPIRVFVAPESRNLGRAQVDGHRSPRIRGVLGGELLAIVAAPVKLRLVPFELVPAWAGV